MQSIAEKLSEIEAEMEEYKYIEQDVVHTSLFACRVVIEALKPLDGSRKCHRLINGVLVERSVSQVLPALQVNYDKVPHQLTRFTPSKPHRVDAETAGWSH